MIEMRIVVVFLLVWVLFGCEDRYRYFCQNPDNFTHESCQRPRCQFTQTCPEYLVAPVLEKQIERSNEKAAGGVDASAAKPAP